MLLVHTFLGLLCVVSTCFAATDIDQQRTSPQASFTAKATVPLDALPEASAGREGGDTIETAVPIASLPFTDTGNTCDFSHDYGEMCPYGPPHRSL
jgi:hypothetical protein